MRGTVLESLPADRTVQRSASASAAGSSRSLERVQAWDFQPAAPMRQADPDAPQAKALAAPKSPG
eukprot:3904867-Alexandrium_andersonii.AAC.1